MTATTANEATSGGATSYQVSTGTLQNPWSDVASVENDDIPATYALYETSSGSMVRVVNIIGD